MKMKETDTKISVIMPVFQREAFLHRSIGCILNQSYSNFEMIIVDDGSTDNTGLICDRYAENDSRVHVIHQKNMGTYKAREVGIHNSEGEFICFIDSDDYVEKDYLEKLANWAVHTGADVVLTGMRLVYSNGETKDMFISQKERLIEKKEAIKGMISRDYYGWELVAKLYKKDLFDDFKCSVNIKYAEDLLTNWEIFNKARLFYYFPYVGYNYYRHSDNMTLNVDIRRTDKILAYNYMLKNSFGPDEDKKSIIRVIEQGLSEMVIYWILSGEAAGDGFYKILELLNDTLTLEKKLGMIPERDYIELKCEFVFGSSMVKLFFSRFIDYLRQYFQKNKRNYIFGCGKWALCTSKLLDDNNIHYDGFVVTKMQNVDSKKKLITAEIKELKDIDKDSGIFICVSEKARKEVLSFLEDNNINNCLDLSGGRRYIDYYSKSPLSIMNRPEIQTVLHVDISNKLHSNRTIIFESRMGFGLGGIEAWTRQICEGLVDKGIGDIFVLSRFNDYKGKLSDIVDIVEESEDIREYYLDLLKYYLDRLPCILVSSQPTEELLVATIIKEMFPDAMSIISVIHGDHNTLYNKYLPLLTTSDIVVAVSKKIRSELIKMELPQKKIIIKPALFTYKEYEKRSYSIEEGTYIKIGYAGRVEYSQKRADLLMKLIEDLRNRNMDFRFEVAGDGVATDDLKRFVEENGFEDKVKLVGVIENEKMPDFWMRQDIAVNMADYEGHSISQMEAMAGGAVPVVTYTSGTDDDIIDGVNGFIVPLGDYRGAADKIEYLYNNRDKISEMGEKAHNYMIEKGNYNKHIDFWEEILGLGKNNGFS